MPQTKGSRIAEGRQAELFGWGDKQALKLFRGHVPLALVESEAEIGRAVQRAGLPVPGVMGVAEVEGRRGIVFERVEGRPMLAEIASNPQKLFRYARVLAELHCNVHDCIIDSLPPQRDRLRNRIQAAEILPENKKAAALEALNRLPDGERLCHGDFHPDNIIMSPRGPVIIDWPDATQGNPIADVARTSLMLRIAPVPNGTRGRWMMLAARSLFHRRYLERYMKLSGITGEQLAAWLLPVAAARLSENIAGEQGRLLRLIDKRLSRMA